MVGLTIAGFGLSTVLVAPLLNMSFQTLGFQHTLVTFGISSTLFLFILFWLLTRKLDISKLYLKHHKEKVNQSKFLFTMFFIIFTLGIMFGLSMIGLTLYIGIDYYQMPADTIAIYMSLFALANGLFRPLFGYIYDRMHLKFSVILLSFMTLVVASIYIFFNPNQSWLFILTMILSWGSVGGWLSLMPTITKDIFGKNNFNRTYGHMYLGYGVAAVIGNLYTSILIDSSINLSVIFVPILCISLLTMATVSIMKIEPYHKLT
ncbi:MAG: OFA family MFS transporter [Ruminococcaceae bacterium]|nr:OFA family MFS transporter [Oscillospiraceae bacterium]